MNRPRLNRNAWARERTCRVCGKCEHVRRDNASDQCLSCAARARRTLSRDSSATQFKPGPRPATRNRYLINCEHCGHSFFTVPSANKGRRRRRFCSIACRRAGQRVNRQCRMCGGAFSVPRSVISGKTNATANFCCRICYNQWLAQSPIEPTKGHSWAKISREVIAAYPFCAWCGFRCRARLEVHHIIPYRLTRDNSLENLIPLCASCHKRIETKTKLIESAAGNPLSTYGPFWTILRFRQMNTAALIRRLVNEIDAAQSGAMGD